MRPPHTLLNESFRLQFPFVFRRPQSLQLLLPAHPCPPLSLPAFSGLPLSRPSAASASLSDPRCFRLLSLASVLGSDYSAFRAFFSLLPVSPGGGSFGACLSAFRSACFHASLSALVLSFLHFLSPLRCLASQWLPQLLASCFQLGQSPLLSL